MASIWSEIWNGLIKGLNYILQAFYHLGGYGVAIILLTIVVKLILLPLTWKQTKSMIALQRLQPEMKKLQEKYKNDKEKLGQEMMKFYKENKVNPLSGCLPLLLQMPVFIALYEVLRKYVVTPPIMLTGNVFISGSPLVNSSKLFFSKTGFLWIHNLSDSTMSADPYWILIILMALTTWYSQKQVMSDPRQQKMMLIMPFLMAFIAIRLPAGVVLYWIVTNVLQIAQQYAVSRVDKKRQEAEGVGKPKASSKGALPPPEAEPAKKSWKARLAEATGLAVAAPAEEEKPRAESRKGAPAGKSAQKPKPGTAQHKPGSGAAKPKPKGTGAQDVRKPKPKPASKPAAGKSGGGANRPPQSGSGKKKGKGRK